MKITIENTSDLYRLDNLVKPDRPMMVRKWIGTTESGVPVHVYVALISPQTHDSEVNAQFERELQERPVFIFDEPP